MRIATRKDQRRSSQRSPRVATWIFYLSSAALAWQFALYPLTLKLLTLLRPSTKIRRRPFTPSLTVIIAAHNEEAVIERRIQNTWDCEYPREQLEIIVADDGSTDGTPAIISRLSEGNPPTPLLLVRQEQWVGKVRTLNEAMGQARGEIIVLTDAPALFDKEALREVVCNFADERVGGVTGVFRPIGEHTRAQQAERLFWSLKNQLIELEGQVDSTTFASGKLNAFRKVIMDSLDEGLLGDDVNVAMKVRAAGYRMVLDPGATCYQSKPSSFDELMSRKSKSVAGGLDQSFHFRGMLLRPRYGLFGLLIYPTRILFTPLSPLFALAAMLSAIRIATRALHLSRPAVGMLVALLAGLAASPLRSRLPPLILTYLFNQWVLLKGLAIWLAGAYDVKWEQAESIRAAVLRDDDLKTG